MSQYMLSTVPIVKTFDEPIDFVKYILTDSTGTYVCYAPVGTATTEPKWIIIYTKDISVTGFTTAKRVITKVGPIGTDTVPISRTVITGLFQ